MENVPGTLELYTVFERKALGLGSVPTMGVTEKNKKVVLLLVGVNVLVTQLCLTLCNLMDASPLGSSVYGILQARILEWVAISFSRGSSQPMDQTWVSCIAGGFFAI